MKTTIWTQILREIRRLRSGYRPERHYMRGPRRTGPTQPQSKAGKAQRKGRSGKSNYHPATADAGE